MKRSTAARKPHRSAYGTPRSMSPSAMPMPKLVLMIDCIRRYRLMRWAASSSTRVVVVSRL
jgi:hypothetical protein